MTSRPPPLRRVAAPQPAPAAAAAPVAAQPDIAPRAPAGTLAMDPTEEIAYGTRGLFRSCGSCGVSMLFHLAALLLLAYLTIPDAQRQVRTLVEAAFAPPDETLPVEVELDEAVQASLQSAMSSPATLPLDGIASELSRIEAPAVLDREILESTRSDAVPADLRVDFPLAGAPEFAQLVEALPEGEFRGESRAIIDDYEQALDRIAQELVWMMDRGPVLLVWAFDQSGSMKDDQQEIRDRINNVYVQLGLVGRDERERLLTSVVSFGEGFVAHTPRPTSDFGEIRAAIEAVPSDESGKEFVCQAVIASVRQHRDLARVQKRQLALVVVTDESGEQEDNRDFLEGAIAEARHARSRIYVLGREAVFGYPYAQMRWMHPQTNAIHWLPVNRGPETGFVEQLQIDGFRRRHDAFPSGFGPYELCRMSRETGGIFFLLPGLESSIVRGEKRRYELELLRPFRPDLRSREAVLADRERFPLRTLIWTCIYDLNPYERPQVASEIEMRVRFSPDFGEFVQQVRIEQAKIPGYLVYLARVQEALEGGRRLREEEADPRWRANYDLILAQLVAYQARIWEYGAALEEFVRNPQVVPLTKPPDLKLEHWDVHVRSQTRTEESRPYIERAGLLFQRVVDEYSGTPWAVRASGELQQGFGVEFHPEYWRTIYDYPGGVTVPVPKL